MKRIVFLWQELSGYFLACINEINKNNNVELLVVYKNPKKINPHNINKVKNMSFMISSENFNNKTIMNKIREFRPNYLILNGWNNLGYNMITYKAQNLKIKIILCLDNIWYTSLKQKIWAFIFKNFLNKYFYKIFVPFFPHYEYANNLGFKKNRIINFLYSCNTELFYSKNIKQKKNELNFIFVGRLIHQKGVDLLYHSFISVKKNFQI